MTITFFHGFLITCGSTLLYSIPWLSVFLILRLVNINYYSVQCSRKCKIIQRNLERSSSVGDDNKMFGYSIGKWYILHCSYELSRYNNTPTYKIWIIGTKGSYEKLTKVGKDVSDDEKESKQMLTVYDTNGNYRYSNYVKREIKIMKHSPRENQKIIIDSIKAHYEKNKNVICFIHGNPGTGKTMLSLLLAFEMKCSISTSFKPWEPSQKLCELYEEVGPTESSPLIISFDEIDVVLKKIHSGGGIKHKDAKTEIVDKSGWNKFFDDIDYGLFPNLIIVMTSNVNPVEINKLDKSYLRDGRVNLLLEL